MTPRDPRASRGRRRERLVDILLRRRFQRGFERDLVPESRLRGMDGFLEEVLAFHALEPEVRHASVKGHLRQFFGPGGALVRAGMRRAPGLTLWLARRSLPRALGWMVGTIRHEDPDPQIVECTVLKRCGQDVCVDLCKRPTEDFFRSDLDVDLELRPDFVSAACLVRMRPRR